MGKEKARKDAKVINVVDEFDYSTQPDSYNKKFIEWRKDKKNPYAYNFSMNKDETVYIDGQGFIEKYEADASAAEASSIGKVLTLLGVVILMIVMTEMLFGKLLVFLLDIVGVDIHNAFYNSVIYGGVTEVATVLIIINSLKLIIPTVFLQSKLRMPLRVALPSQLRDPLELIAAMALALIASVVVCIPSAFSEQTAEMYAFFRNYKTDMSLWNQSQFVVYAVFDVVIMSVLYEMLFRGSIFAALRQFGDVFAIIITSVAAGLATMDIKSFVGTAVISVVASVGYLRSGTIFTPIAVRIIYKMYLFTLNILEMNTSDSMIITRNMFMTVVFLFALAVFGLIYTSEKRRKVKTVCTYRGHMTLKSQLFTSMRTFIFSASVLICLFVSIIQGIV